MEITAQDRKNWVHHSVTQELLVHLREAKQETMGTWAVEGYVGKTGEETLLQNATALGGMRVLDQVIEIILALDEGE